MEAHFTLTVLVVALLVCVDSISELAVHVPELISILAAFRVCKIWIIREIITPNGFLPLAVIEV